VNSFLTAHQHSAQQIWWWWWRYTSSVQPWHCQCYNV